MIFKHCVSVLFSCPAFYFAINSHRSISEEFWPDVSFTKVSRNIFVFPRFFKTWIVKSFLVLCICDLYDFITIIFTNSWSRQVGCYLDMDLYIILYYGRCRLQFAAIFFWYAWIPSFFLLRKDPETFLAVTYLSRLIGSLDF